MCCTMFCHGWPLLLAKIAPSLDVLVHVFVIAGGFGWARLVVFVVFVASPWSSACSCASGCLWFLFLFLWLPLLLDLCFCSCASWCFCSCSLSWTLGLWLLLVSHEFAWWFWICRFARSVLHPPVSFELCFSKKRCSCKFRCLGCCLFWLPLVDAHCSGHSLVFKQRLCCNSIAGAYVFSFWNLLVSCWGSILVARTMVQIKPKSTWLCWAVCCLSKI